jgi:PAS domain S-box-containing protein
VTTGPPLRGQPPAWADKSFRSLLEAAPDAMLVVDRAGEIVLANLQAEKLFGYGCDELIGRSVESLIPPRFRTEHPQHRGEYFGAPRLRPMGAGLELFASREDSSEVPVEISLSPLTNEAGTFVVTAIRDATERRRIEELKRADAVLRETRESEQRFRLVADTAPVLIWMSDTDKLCTYFNKPWLYFTGRSMEQEFGNGWAEGVHPDDFQRCLNTYTQSFDSREKFGMEYRLRRHDGEYRWVLDIGVPRFNEDGSFAGYIGIAVDISDRKKTEQALQEGNRVLEEQTALLRSQEELLKIFVKHVPAAVAMLDRDMRYLQVSDRWCVDFSLDSSQLLGRSHYEIFPDVPDRWKQILRRTLAGETLRCDEDRWDREGGTVWLRWETLPWQNLDGLPGGILIFSEDITQRKQFEAALRTSEERLRMGQWAARIGSYEWNIRTGVSIWTPELEALYGLPPGGFGGTRDAFENLVYPNDRARVIDLIDEAIKTGQPAEGEWRVVWPDGSLHWIAARGQVSVNESGEPSRMFGVHLDITERKRTEEALSDMTRKLVEAQEQERARIARELHDDITQRLAMLAIEIEQVQEHAETPSEVRERVHELSNRTKDISSDVQALSHELHSSKLEYLGIVGGMKSWCSEFGERQGMEIEFKSSGLRNSLPSEISLCLFRVLQEALHNAAKHSGVERVDVQLREESCEIHLIVSDFGKGFDVASAMQNRGLGVTSMQERVRLVGGTIVIDSKPLGGTTIHVRVPLGAERSFQRAPG